ncbi:MAG: Flp pilus assembly protein CpaB [Planctomycetota bacterium]|jgi:hypothetical protein
MRQAIVFAVVLGMLTCGLASAQEKPKDPTLPGGYLDGVWSIEGTHFGDSIKGSLSVRRAANKRANVYNWSYRIEGGRTVRGVGVGGFDPETEKFIEYAFNSEGDHFRSIYPPSPIEEEGIIHGERIGVVKGKAYKGKIRVERKGAKEFTYTVTSEESGDDQHWTFRKVADAPAAKKKRPADASKRKLTSKEPERGLEALIPKGMRAYTIQAKGVGTNVARFVLPGSRVDVLLHLRRTRDDAPGGGSTTTLLQSVEVLAVGQALDAPDEKRLSDVQSVTLLVTPEQATLLDLGQTAGTLSLSLRNANDTGEAKTVPAILKDIRYRQEKPLPAVPELPEDSSPGEGQDRRPTPLRVLPLPDGRLEHFKRLTTLEWRGLENT